VAYLDDLHAVLDALTRTRERSDAAGFIERNRALDELEMHLLEMLHHLNGEDVVDRRIADVATQVVALRGRLQRINDSMAQRLRERIAAASISPGELLATFQQYVGGARHDTRDQVQYDDLDVLVASLLHTEEAVDEGAVEWHPEMVRYQPTPARLILAMIRETRPTERDVFVDVGSGLGTVPTLVSLLTGARAVGIEWHPNYCAHAERRARALNLSSVSFVRQDARDADFSSGTIFYMYTPFQGTMLRDVLQRLDDEGRRRTIRLCIHGPLLREAIQEFTSFSGEKAGSHDDFIAVFRSSPVARQKEGPCRSVRI
jgi:tRNA G46 methylase TrmB